MNTCATCKWWRDTHGECVRFPPVTIIVFKPAVFPLTEPTATCGEHSPIPKPKAEADGDYSLMFLAFWQIYPPRRKTNKPGAWKAWKAAVKSGVKPETILDAVAEFAKSSKGRGEFCPGPVPWLNQHRWLDDRNSWWDETAAPPKKSLPALSEDE